MSSKILRQRKTGYFRNGFVFILVVLSLQSRAQMRDNINLPDHDDKFYHLGIALIFNTSHFQVTPHPNLLLSDSVLSISPKIPVVLDWPAYILLILTAILNSGLFFPS
jgi:hypothetical protein